MALTLRYASIDDLEPLAVLFDGYRQFYGQSPDLALARDFLAGRFRHHESVVLVAEAGDGSLLGFTQLYPSFSSVRAKRIYVLNDLFVSPAARQQGVARALLEKAAAVGRSLGAVKLNLSTARTNEKAQRLYEALGWKRDELFLDYSLLL